MFIVSLWECTQATSDSYFRRLTVSKSGDGEEVVHSPGDEWGRLSSSSVGLARQGSRNSCQQCLGL